MLITNRRHKRLAIIGNGFDLAHGYKTTFAEFVKHTSSSDLDTFRKFCDEDKITNWHNFEENVKLITINFWQNNFMGDCDYNEISNKIEQLNQVFENIHELLQEFLKKEINRFQVQKKRNVKRCINSRTKVITFNYTNVAELYTKDIFYVHGSIDEDDIVLGYDYREEPCLISMEYMYWSKKFRRELLAFKRYLETKEHLNSGDPDFELLVENFQKYQMYANSGRGIDEEVEEEIKGFDKINDFTFNKCESIILPVIDYEKIKTIILLGHGLESDEKFLREILQKLTKLKKVIIFTYNGEDDISLNKKIMFFKQYCKKVYIRHYD